MDAPKVIAVVLNYRRPQETLECINSLKKLDYTNIEIVIVDNASADDSVVKIRTAHPDVSVIVTEHNQGYAGGMNNGFRFALQKNPAYILAINSDTLIERQALQTLVEVLTAESSAAAATGTIYYQGEQEQVWYRGGKLNYYRAGGFQQHGAFHVESLLPRSVTFISGCAFLIKAPILQEIGLFDERFFMYFEDAELCMRVLRRKYKLLYIPRARFYHQVTSDALTAFRCYFSVRNRLLFLSLVSNPVKKIIGLFYLTGVFSIKYIRWRIQNQAFATALSWGVEDFLLRRWYDGRAFHLNPGREEKNACP